MKKQILSEEFRKMQKIAGIITENNDTETPSLNPSMQKRFDMMVNALKKSKSEEDVSRVYTNLMLLPKNLRKIFIDKLVSMGWAEITGPDTIDIMWGDDNESVTKY
jgi:hypothetical protein